MRPKSIRDLLRKTGLSTQISPDEEISSQLLIKLRCGELISSVMKESDIFLCEHKKWYLQNILAKIAPGVDQLKMESVANDLYDKTLKFFVNPIN